MPNLDGISATRNIRQYDTWTPIISMTANTTDRDVREYIMSGMTDVLPKPLDQSMLCKLLERYCAHLKLMQRRQIPRTIQTSDNSTTSSLLATARPSLNDNDPIQQENNSQRMTVVARSYNENSTPDNELQGVTTWVEMTPEDFTSSLPQQQQISTSSTIDHYHTNSSIASSSTSSTSSSSSLSVADLQPVWSNNANNPPFHYNIPTCTFMLNQEIPSATTTIKQEEEEENNKRVNMDQASPCKKLKSSSWQ